MAFVETLHNLPISIHALSLIALGMASVPTTKANFIRKRDGSTCQMNCSAAGIFCGGRGSRTNIHHITPQAYTPEGENPHRAENLILLCAPFHGWLHHQNNPVVQEHGWDNRYDKFFRRVVRANTERMPNERSKREMRGLAKRMYKRTGISPQSFSGS